MASVMVGLGVGEAREAAMIGVPCLGSMTSAALVAIVGFACAVLAMYMAVGVVEFGEGGMLVRGGSRPPRRAAVLVGALGVLCFAPVATAALRTYEVPQPVALRGFSGGGAQGPQFGAWKATGRYRVSEGLGRRAQGEKITRALVIQRVCARGACHLTITRSYDYPRVRLTARLVRHADGWHALFPALRFACSSSSDGTSAPMRSQWIMRFRHGGRTLDARERVFVYRRGCQYRNSLVEWSATLTAPDRLPIDPRAKQPAAV